MTNPDAKSKVDQASTLARQAMEMARECGPLRDQLRDAGERDDDATAELLRQRFADLDLQLLRLSGSCITAAVDALLAAGDKLSQPVRSGIRFHLSDLRHDHTDPRFYEWLVEHLDALARDLAA